MVDTFRRWKREQQPQFGTNQALLDSANSYLCAVEQKMESLIDDEALKKRSTGRPELVSVRVCVCVCITKQCLTHILSPHQLRFWVTMPTTIGCFD
jgi:hypothetical protein